MNAWHALDKKEVIEGLRTSEIGLSQKEASSRLNVYGNNELKQISQISPLMILFQQFKSVFILILLAAAVFSLLIQHYVDFGVIAAIVLINSLIGFFQQYKAEKTISEMRDMLVPKVKVIRENKLTEVLSTEIVPGDILMISEGDKVMADCRLIHVNELQMNEAVLTGESFPQSKNSGKISMEAELADRENMIYMGTTVARGNAKAVVVSTGMNTEFGKIAGLVQHIKIKKTPLEEKLDSFSKKVAVIVLILAALTTLIGVLRGEDVFQMFLTGISLAVAVIPEGLPAVIAFTLALAIQRMQKNKALIRKLPAAETLGRTTVICTDKTGTLTEEEMIVTEMYCGKSEKAQLLKIGIMCNNARIEGDKLFGDPTEKALILSAQKAGLIKKEELEKEIRVIEYSFSSKRKMMSIVRKKDGKLTSYVKGAPDLILKNCSREIFNGQIRLLSERRKKEIIAVYERMASKALRVLAFAYKNIPEKFNQQIAERDLIFVGFQGMIDPPRKEVKLAIKECKTAGINVKMVTGDSVLTARAVAEMIGLDTESIEGHELEKLSDFEFNDVVRQKTIFARITPELKLKIIQSLKKQGEIVAVTGDGINDILALKEAHIGVAMGIRGTDVAREVSDIILLDDNFNSIVKAVREGRRVYDNMKKSIKFHLGANMGELLLVLMSMILYLPLPLLPLAILWMNLITDSLPSLALSVEKEEKDIMKRKPTKPEENILENITGFIVIAGLIMFIVTIGLFLLFYKADVNKARTIVLTTAVFYEMFIVFTCRSDKNLWKIGVFSNKFLSYSVIAAIVLQLAAVYTPLAAIFGFKALSFVELLLVVASSSLGFVFFELTKLIKHKKINGFNRIHKEY